MSEDAQEEVEGWFAGLEVFQNHESELEIRRTQMEVRTMALQQAGVIPLDLDIERAHRALMATDKASLRSKGTDEG